MRYVYDNDLHLHSQISLCSSDPGQTNERILQYAKDNGLKTVCLADHFWDETINCTDQFYILQDYKRIAAAKPLPQAEGIKFLFGCETDLDKDLNLGVSKEKYDLFDFIVIPINHFHILGFIISEEDSADLQRRVNAWIRRFDAVLNMDLPFHKVGLAHLTCPALALDNYRPDYLKGLNLIPEEEMKRLFTKAAKLGVGIEINAFDMNFTDEEADTVLKMYRIAKECGCKFYCASDSHHPKDFDIIKERIERAIDLIGLEETDKFII